MLLLSYQANWNEISWWQVLQAGSEKYLLPQRFDKGKLDVEDM